MNTVRGRRPCSARLATLGLAGVLSIALAGVPVVADAVVDPASPAEQWLVYELNRARWNPTAYAADHGVTPAAAVIPQPPLAGNTALFGSTGFKAQQTYQYPTKFQSNPSLPNYHCSNATGTWVCPNQLAVNHGYPLPSWWPLNQNFIEVYWASSGTGLPNGVAGFLASSAHVGVLFQWTNYEVGVGQHDGCQPGAASACNYVFVHVGQRSPVKLFISGVVYDDANGNGLMDLGEGLPGVAVSGGSGLGTTTNAGGGYSLQVTAGTYTLTASGGGFPGATANATVSSYNVTADFVAGDSTGTVRSYELCEGLQPNLVGTDHADTLIGTAGNDVIQGLDGDDIIVGGGGDDILCGGGGTDTINGTREPSRLAGSDRYATGAEVARFSHPQHTDVVYLAVGTNYPDAISAGPAAASEDAPILLVSATGIPTATRDELLRLTPHQIVILGGAAAIPDAVVAQVANLLPQAEIERRSGATRYETAAAISQAAFSSPVTTVFIATGENFADALIVAPIAATSASPLLLVRPTGTVPDAVAAELTRLAPEQIIVVGNAAAISDDVLTQLAGFAPTTRVDATDRFALSATVSGLMYPAGAQTAYIATGANFPDALTAGPATTTSPGPLLLVGSSIPAAVAAELERLNPESIIILGGTAAVSNAIAEQLIAYLD